MIKSIISIAALLIFSTNDSFCQQAGNQQVFVLKGSVLDSDTKLPLPYASVGILNTPFGTLTDTLGVYGFKVEQYSESDSIQVSMVGYYAARISVIDLLKSTDKTVLLTKKMSTLREVKVSNRKPVTEIIGRQSSGGFTQVSMHNKSSVQETVGSEFGVRMSMDHPSAVLKDFNWLITKNNFKRIRLRLNVYSVKDDYPDTLICEQQIITTIPPYHSGWNRINLEDYDINVTGDFIITLQWLDHATDNESHPVTLMPVSMTPFSRNCYVRVASQDKWKRLKMKPSCYATISY